MAGDLFIMNITRDDEQIIKNAGGQLVEHIYHANRNEPENFDILQQQLRINVQNRKGLPPHAYIVFTRKEYNSSTVLLKNFLAKVSRPLGVVTNQQALKEWDNKIHDRSEYLGIALQKINVTLEYYQYDGKNLLNTKNFVRNFTRNNE